MTRHFRALAVTAVALIALIGTVAVDAAPAAAASGGGCSTEYVSVNGLPISFNSCISASRLTINTGSNVRNGTGSWCYGQITLYNASYQSVDSSLIFGGGSGNHTWSPGVYFAMACVIPADP
jgi:hypothetical protein